MAPARKPPLTPKGLSPEAAELWKRFHLSYALRDAAACSILESGLMAFMVMRQCEAVVAKDGPVSTDRYGSLRAHPAAEVGRSHRQQWVNALKALGLHHDEGGQDAATIYR